ncbi:MAG: hypothetical protein A2Z12_08005 [Actinobacteria bacterium RBG_16_68_21]|nr:MAG: hypothetical protein A2Z12_08005 [Actinobacteria bacterium RBG_16_68_21]
MVLTEAAERATHHTAAATAASIHLHFEGSVVETPLAGFVGNPDLDGVAVVAPERGIVEWFPSDLQALEPLAAMSRASAGPEWQVSVIVPAGRMGEAHRALRGAPVTLQPWWFDDESVRFGGPEVP